MSKAAEAIRGLNYRFCVEQSLGLNTIIHYYSWDLLDCHSPANPTRYQTELIDYDFYKAGFSSDANAVIFIGRWTPKRDFNPKDYNMSYQLISEDWRNIAQLDLPLVAEGELRQYAIDVSHVPPGTYRLMLILYSAGTDDRLPWDGNPGDVPEMLPLDTITIEDA